MKVAQRSGQPRIIASQDGRGAWSIAVIEFARRFVRELPQFLAGLRIEANPYILPIERVAATDDKALTQDGQATNAFGRKVGRPKKVSFGRQFFGKPCGATIASRTAKVGPIFGRISG